MILFQEDYRHYPTAIIDYDTPNRSFVELAKLYRDKGIKNNVFHLVLINPALKGVDPHSKHLTEEQKQAIALEIKINPWYFLREVLKAPARSGTHPPPIRANRSNISLWWCFLNHCQFFLIQPRQTGKSLNTDGIMVWLICFRCVNTEINLLTKDDGLRRTNIQRIKDLIEDLPEYLQLRTRLDANNGEEITVKALGNTYKTHVPQASPKRAINLGRGLSTAIFHSDEGPFCPNIKISIPAAFAAMGAAIEEAKANNAPYGTIFTTTAGKRDDKDGKYIFDLLQDAAVWDERYFDCKDAEDFERQVRNDSKADRKRHRNGVFRINATFSHRQLGYDDEWLAARIEEALAEGDDVNRDFMNVWTAGSEKSPFSPEVAEAISMSKTEPFCRSFSDIEGYVTNWYLEEEEVEHYLHNRPILLGCDASENIGKDETTLHFLDVSSLKTIGTAALNNTNVYLVAEHILQLLVKYPNITLVPEAKNMGVAIINYLVLKLPLFGIDPFRRIFNRVVQEKDDSEANQEAYEWISRHGTDANTINHYRSKFGYTTSSSGQYSRESLYGNTFKIALNRAKDWIYDETLADQLLTLTIRNGRIDHEVGGHDDMVVAWLLNFWLLVNGKHLSHYGIHHTSIMAEANAPKAMTVEQYHELLEQNEIRKRMIELYDELIHEEDEFVSMKIEQQLRLLNQRIILRDHETYSLDTLINQVKDRKRDQRRAKQFNQLR